LQELSERASPEIELFPHRHRLQSLQIPLVKPLIADGIFGFYLLKPIDGL
jgi:hypothetical protein